MKKSLFSMKNFALISLALPFIFSDGQAQGPQPSAHKAPHLAAPAKIVTHVNLTATKRSTGLNITIVTPVAIWWGLNHLKIGETIKIDPSLLRLLADKDLVNVQKTYEARKVADGVVEIRDLAQKDNDIVRLSIEGK